MFSCLLNIVRLRQIRPVINVSHQCLHQIMQGDDSYKTAIFIQHYCKIIPFLPHFPEDQVSTHGFRYKKRRITGMIQNSSSGSVIQAEIISGIQNMDNIILIFPAYRIKGVTVLSDNPFPFLI